MKTKKLLVGWCCECGPLPITSLDEDGCCAMCGNGASGEGARKALRLLRQRTSVKAEREACAAIADKGTVENGGISDWGVAGNGIAKAIRARKP